MEDGTCHIPSENDNVEEKQDVEDVPVDEDNPSWLPFGPYAGPETSDAKEQAFEDMSLYRFLTRRSEASLSGQASSGLRPKTFLEAASAAQQSLFDHAGRPSSLYARVLPHAAQPLPQAKEVLKEGQAVRPPPKPSWEPPDFDGLTSIVLCASCMGTDSRCRSGALHGSLAVACDSCLQAIHACGCIVADFEAPPAWLETVPDDECSECGRGFWGCECSHELGYDADSDQTSDEWPDQPEPELAMSWQVTCSRRVARWSPCKRWWWHRQSIEHYRKLPTPTPPVRVDPDWDRFPSALARYDVPYDRWDRARALWASLDWASPRRALARWGEWAGWEWVRQRRGRITPEMEVEDTRRQKHRTRKPAPPVSDAVLHAAFRVLRELKVMDAYLLVCERTREFSAIKPLLRETDRLLFVRIHADRQSCNKLVDMVRTYRGMRPEGILGELSGFEYMLSTMFPVVTKEIARALDALPELVDSYDWIKKNVFSKEAVALYLGLLQFYRAEAADMRVLAVCQVLNAFRDSGVGPYVMRVVQSVLAPKPEMAVDMDYLSDKSAEVLHKVIGAPIACRLVFLIDLFVRSMTFKGLPTALQFSVHSALASFKSFGSEVTLLSEAVSYLGLVVKSVAEFVATGNPLCLLGSQPRDEMIKRTCKLLDEFEAFRRSSSKNLRQQSQLFKEYEQLAKPALEYLGSQKDDLEFRQTFSRLSVVVAAFRIANDSSRIHPPGFILTGKPGTGKTTMALRMGAVVAAHHGVPGVNTVFHFNCGDKYQPVPGCIYTFICDEFFIRNDESQAADSCYMTLLTSFANSTPLTLSGAAVQDKNVHIAPSIIFLTTNASDYHFVRVKADADSISRLRRRYLVIRSEFTEKAYALAAEMKVPIAELVKTVGYTETLVVYKVFRMGVRGNRIIFQDPGEPKKHTVLEGAAAAAAEASNSLVFLREFTSEVEIQEWFLAAIVEAEQNHAKVSDVECCEKGFVKTKGPSGPIFHDHGCEHVVSPEGAVGSTLNWTPHDNVDLEEEETEVVLRVGEERFSYYAAKRKVFQTIEEAAPAAGSQFLEWKDSAKIWGLKASEFLAGIPVETKRCLTALGVWLTFAGVTWAYVSAAGMKEEALVRAIDEPEVRNPLPLSSMKATYLGAKGQPPVCKIERVEIAARMWCVPITSRVYLTAGHFFTGAVGPQVVCPPMKHGDEFRITTSAGTSVEKYDASWVSFQSYDLAFFHVSKPVPGVTTFFGLDCGRAGRVLWSGEEVELSDQTAFPGLGRLSSGTSSRGDCGKPVVDLQGRLVGIHVGSMSIPPYNPHTGLVSLQIYQNVFSRPDPEGFPQFAETDGHPIIKATKWAGEGPHPLSTWKAMSKWNKREVEELTLVEVPLFHLPYSSEAIPTCRPTALLPLVEGMPGFVRMAAPYAGKAFKCEKSPYPNVQWLNAHVHRYMALRLKPPPEGPFPMLRSLLLGRFPKPLVPFGKMSWYQAVCGDPARNSFVNGRDPTKSVGPYMAALGVHKHEAFVEVSPGVHHVHPAVKAEKERIVGVVLEGQLPMPVFKATIKDEGVKETAREIGKGRLFYVGCVGYNLALREYVLPLIAYALDQWRTTGFCGAINCASSEWGEIAEMLSGGVVYERDYTGFDLRHSDVLLTEAAKFVYQLALRCGYPEEDARVSYGLILMQRRYYVLVEGELHQGNTGMCSGVATTSFVNMIINQLLTLNVAVEAGVDPKKVVSCVCGDDKVESYPVAVSGELMQALDRAWGHETTSAANKKLAPHPLEGVHQAHFLKRGFVKDERGRWRCPLEPASIWKALGYLTGRLSSAAELARNKEVVYQMAGESFMHGEKFYERYAIVVRGWEGCPDLPPYAYWEEQYAQGLLIPWDLHLEHGAGVVFDHSAAAQSHEKLENEQFCALLRPELGGESPVNHLRLTELNSTTTLEHSQQSVLASLPPVVDTINHGEPGGASQRESNPGFTDFEVMMTMKMLVATFTLAGGFTVSGLTAQALANNPRALAMSAGYLGFRYKKIKIHASYVGLPTTYGAYRLTFYPTAGMTTPDSPYTTAAWYTNANAALARANLPSLLIDLSKSCDCQIDLPFLNPYDFCSLGVADWSMIVDAVGSSVGNVLGITQPACIIRLFAEFEGFEFAVLHPQMALEESQGATGRARAYMSRVAKTAAWYVGSAMKVARVGLAIAESMGFSRPLIAVGDLMGRVSFSGAYASGGPNTSAGLGMDPAAGRSVEGVLPSGACTKVAELCAKPGFVSFGLVPSTIQTVDPTATVASGTQTMYTPLAYACSFFRLWRGTVHVRLTFYSSPLTRGSIIVAIAANGATPAIATARSATFMEVEVVGTTVVEFDIPYQAVGHMSPAGSGAGSFMWAWTSQPVSNAGAALTINPTVEFWSGDMELEVPGLYLPNITRVSDVVPEGAFTGEDVSDLLLLAKRQSYHLALHNVTSGHGFCLPPDGLVGALAGATLATDEWTLTFDQWLRLSHYAYTGSNVWTFRSLDSTGVWPEATVANYTFFEGPGNIAESAPYDSSIPRGNSGYNYDWSCAGMSYQTVGDVRSVSVPDRSSLKYKLGQVASATLTGGTLASVLYVMPTAGASVRHLAYKAAGEDFQVGGYLAPPVLVTV